MKMMTIAVPDDAYEALKSAGEQAHQSPEELAAATIAERFSASLAPSMTDQQAQRAKEALLATMRAQGHLADPASLPPHPGVERLPKRGTPERAQLEVEIGNALSDALEQSGLSNPA